MATPASRRPILKKNVEAFVPSPRFLSESPVHQLSSGKSTPPPHISPDSFSPSPSIQQLRSPVPPPPANLIGGNPDAFNVDPGVPFLATVGPSDAGDSDKGSINEFESPKRTVGNFVTGLKKALTVKRSRRKSSKDQQEEIYPPLMMVRDSGYATSDRLEATQPPPLTTFSPSPPPTRDLPLATSNDYQTTNDHGHDAPSFDSLASAVTALVGYGPDYIKMDRPTPPQSDVSFNTYMVRFQNFVHELAGLPWMANDRVTVDYYPSATERIHKRFPHRPFITWRSKDYNYADYHLDSETDSLTPHLRLRAPSHASRTDINLESEFSDRTRSPFPYYPQSIIQTPDHRHVRSELEGVRSDLEGEVKSPLPPHASDPLPIPTEWSYPNRENAPNTLPLYSPNSGQTPDMRYPEESRPEWRIDANPSLKTPSAHRYSLMDPEPLPSPNTGRTHGEEPRLGSRNVNATPTRHRPASSNQRWENTPQPENSSFSRLTSEANRPPIPGSGQQPTSPSRPSHKSHNTSRRPRHENAEESGNYVRERTGYVPFEFSENFYGNRYGVGIHGLLPPVGRASSSTSIAPSIKQPQPQYPRSALVTPPSRPGSS